MRYFCSFNVARILLLLQVFLVVVASRGVLLQIGTFFLKTDCFVAIRGILSRVWAFCCKWWRFVASYLSNFVSCHKSQVSQDITKNAFYPLKIAHKKRIKEASINV